MYLSEGKAKLEFSNQDIAVERSPKTRWSSKQFTENFGSKTGLFRGGLIGGVAQSIAG
jgi:hypothetical protein